ncbi:peptidylprolyl isomerase [Streptomyces sp. PTM05]|uniref:Peptidyl-prolyl cis-trans isomerase n=1 Tax=Streptantibioticus parmotrematis TaxID=2873249 RepID=A0ABS7QK61_9ACTN|nr:peptidylprolyl isomerase [Streptantibioticus parmotrematis]MBY8883572.1 peptidylprolyl isomerase [Streptantibioticus parmotrematis]
MNRSRLSLNRRRWSLVAAAALVLGVSGVASADSGSAPHTLALAPHHVRAADTTDSPCGFTPAVPADRFKGIPVFNAAEAAKPYTARLDTSQGPITVRAMTAQAPCTTFSFRFLAQRHYFDGTHCHRLTTQHIYVLQCGDPTGTGSGGPGYSFKDENLTGATYPAGTVAMANAGPNTNGSQFFFVWKDTQLPPDYTPFGTVTGGMDVLQRIARAGEDDQNAPGDGFPTLPVDIRHVQLTRH